MYPILDLVVTSKHPDPFLGVSLVHRMESNRVGTFEVGVVGVAHTVARDTQVVETLSFLKGTSLTQG